MSQDPFQEREAEKYANPIPSREFILEHLTKREKPASRDELAVELHIEGEEQLEGLRRRLRAMERDARRPVPGQNGYQFSLQRPEQLRVPYLKSSTGEEMTGHDTEIRFSLPTIC